MNVNKNLIVGQGYFGDGPYKSRMNGKKTKEYNLWVSILKRCYEEPRKIRNLSYVDCTVCEEWKCFQNFAKWFNEESDYKEGFHLDKDIIFKGNKIYSPETCCFIPSDLNMLLTKRTSHRGKYPISVTKIGNKFQSNMNLNNYRKYLGIYNTPEEAFQVYKKEKELRILDMAEKYKHVINEKTYKALINYKIEITD